MDNTELTNRIKEMEIQIKKERINRRKYGTLDEVKADLFKYIELFYNRKRIISCGWGIVLSIKN